MSEPAVRLEHLRKLYDGMQALRDGDVEVVCANPRQAHDTRSEKEDCRFREHRRRSRFRLVVQIHGKANPSLPAKGACVRERRYEGMFIWVSVIALVTLK